MAISTDVAVVADDPWALPDYEVKTTPWAERSLGSKVKYVLWHCILKPAVFIGLLYMFICSLDFLSSAFRLLAGRAAGETFSNSDILTNPVAGLMIGVLVTVLLQSSSTSTSIVIAMVGAEVLSVKSAVYVIMGANIGTTVTNTIVAMGHASFKDEYRRAFGAATVHDMFNWLTVLVILPLETIFGGLYEFTDLLVNKIRNETTGNETEDSNKEDLEILKVITKPFTDLVVKVDKDIIKDLANDKDVHEKATLLERFCSFNSTTDITQCYTDETNCTLCDNWFAQTGLEDWEVGAILLVVSIVILCLCLYFIIKILQSMLQGIIAKLIKKVINMDIPKVPWLTGYIAIVFGAGATVVVQSSSIFTSTLTPLVGVGLIKIDRMYPLTLGSNIGTTATGILVALVADGYGALRRELQVALVHLFFNVSGILMWYPIPLFRKVPINAAKSLGNITARYKWFAVVYLLCMFFIFPAIVFGLSLAGWYVLVGVGVPILLLIITVVIINVMQSKKPNCLPAKLRTWDFLPLWMHSLDPIDRVLTAACHCCKCCRSSKEEDTNGIEINKETQANGVDKGKENPGFNDPNNHKDIEP